MTTAVAKNSHEIMLAGPVGSLSSYIHAVGAIPVLSKEEEQALARRFHDQEDLDAARELVMAHLRFVVHIAKGYTGYGLPLADLIQEGNVGIMKAVKRFDPDYGVRLVSFAVHWIRAEIHDVRRNGGDLPLLGRGVDMDIIRIPRRIARMVWKAQIRQAHGRLVGRETIHQPPAPPVVPHGVVFRAGTV